MRVSVDDGRLYVPEYIREVFGEEFELIEREDSLLLVPVPDDPLEAFREAAMAPSSTQGTGGAGAGADDRDRIEQSSASRRQERDCDDDEDREPLRELAP